MALAWVWLEETGGPDEEWEVHAGDADLAGRPQRGGDHERADKATGERAPEAHVYPSAIPSAALMRYRRASLSPCERAQTLRRTRRASSSPTPVPAPPRPPERCSRPHGLSAQAVLEGEARD